MRTMTGRGVVGLVQHGYSALDNDDCGLDAGGSITGMARADVLDVATAQPTGSFLSATLTQNLTVVPEPGTLVLLLTGGLGLALAALRRRRRS